MRPSSLLMKRWTTELIDAAKRHLDRIPTPDEATVKRAVAELDQGKEAIRVRQKHIRIADHSDWGVVEEYIADELASDSDDEKKLYKARKERETKNKKAATAFKRKPRQEGAMAGQTSSGGAGTKLSGNRTRLIGPCYNCAGWGHLAASCPKGKQHPYPLSQPVVSGLDLAVCNVHGDVSVPADGGVPRPVPGTNSSAFKCVDDPDKQIAEVNLLTGGHKTGCESQKSPQKESVDKPPNLIGEVTDKAGEDRPLSVDDLVKVTSDCVVGYNIDPDTLLNQVALELGKCWEHEECSTPAQIVDVQGRLKRNLEFWREVLHAPSPVIDWIQNGYKLPLKYMPSPLNKCNHRSAINNQTLLMIVSKSC